MSDGNLDDEKVYSQLRESAVGWWFASCHFRLPSLAAYYVRQQRCSRFSVRRPIGLRSRPGRTNLGTKSH